MSVVMPDRIGRFEIIELIGRGGMATVYRGRDPELGRTVAVKVLTAGLAADPVFRQRFLRESEAAAALDHPNIVPLYERGESDGQLYVAMRYVPGGDLGHLVADGPLPVDRALAIVGQMARALDYAHRRGHVHRDVKPANILVDRDGHADHAYLTDFGIVKVITDTATSTTLTQTGQVVGTPAFMAPEQLAGQAVDARTDVYALACVLFTSLTGRPPFPDSGLAQLMHAHLHNIRPRASAAWPGVPPSVDEVLVWAMATDPAHRPPTCESLVQAVHTALAAPAAAPATAMMGAPVTTTAAMPPPPPPGGPPPGSWPPGPPTGPPRGSSRPPWLPAALATAAVVVLIVSLLLWQFWPTAATVTPTTRRPPETTSTAVVESTTTRPVATTTTTRPRSTTTRRSPTTTKPANPVYAQYCGQFMDEFTEVFETEDEREQLTRAKSAFRTLASVAPAPIKADMATFSAYVQRATDIDDLQSSKEPANIKAVDNRLDDWHKDNCGIG